MILHPRRILRPLLSVAVLTLMTASFVQDAGATAVSGRFSVWSYLRDDSVDHVQVVPSLSLNVFQAGHRDLTFQTTLRGYADFRDGESNAEQLRVQRALLIYAPRQSKWKLRLGQQWINEGVGRGNVAGLWVQVAPCPNGTVTAYAGSRTPRTLYLNSDDGENPDEGMSAGVHFRRKLGRHRVGVSYTYLGKDGEILYHGAGADAILRLHRTVLLRSRLYVNLEQSSVERAQLTAKWTVKPTLLVTGELRSQTPRIFEDSYFVRFLEDAHTNHARGAVRWVFLKDYYLKTAVAGVFGDDLLYRARFGLGHPYLELGYTHWLTVADGTMNGFYGQGQYDLCPTSRVFGGFDYARGENADIGDLRESQAIYFGATYDPWKWLGISARAEHIRDFERSDDWRGLFSLTSRFSTLAGGLR